MAVEMSQSLLLLSRSPESQTDCSDSHVCRGKTQMVHFHRSETTVHKPSSVPLICTLDYATPHQHGRWSKKETQTIENIVQLAQRSRWKWKWKQLSPPRGYAYEEPGFIGGTNGNVLLSGRGGLLWGMAVVNGRKSNYHTNSWPFKPLFCLRTNLFLHCSFYF